MSPILHTASTRTLSNSDAPECNADNRPPNPSPVNTKNGKSLDYNNMLRRDIGQHHAWISTFSSFHGEALMLLHMYDTSRIGGEYDVKSVRSPYNGDDADGNFIYGARMTAFGFSLDQTIRVSAAYQGVQDLGKVLGAFKGIVNYATNTGDNKGDAEQAARSWKYKTEVFDKNVHSPQLASCLDMSTLAGNTPSSGGENGGGNGSGNNGIIVTDPQDYEGEFCWERGTVCTGGGCTHWVDFVRCGS